MFVDSPSKFKLPESDPFGFEEHMKMAYLYQDVMKPLSKRVIAVPATRPVKLPNSNVRNTAKSIRPAIYEHEAEFEPSSSNNIENMPSD